MATDATGTPTSLGIPTYNVNADAPSGNGFNAAMAEIDTLIQARILSPAGIQPGEWATWNGSAWVRSSQTTRTVVGRSIFTSGSGATYNLPTGVQAILVELLGGGGTGGTAQTGSANAQAASSGGWGGSYVTSLITSPAASYTYTVGAGGAALAGGGTAGAGNAGHDTTFGALVAKGGAGGTGDSNTTPSHGTPFVVGISGQVTGNVGDIIVPGGAPGEGLIIATNFLVGGEGGRGAGPYGGPGAPAAAGTSHGSGNAPPSGGFGAGSSGSTAGAFSSGDLGVAAGQGGLIVITEFH